MSNKSLALAQADPRTGIDIGWWNMAKEQAGVLVKTGFLPQAIKTPEQALAVMLKGRELGVPAMYALSNIAVIQGKPTANAELMLSLVYRDHGKDAIRVAESTNESCTVEWKSWGEVKSYTFTMEDAKRAGLLSNQTWAKYPAAMLRARCVSAVCRMAFPESIGGMYSPDEMGADVIVTDDGIVEVAPQPSTSSRARATVVSGGDADNGHAYDPGSLEAPQTWFKKLFAVAREAGMDSDALHAFLERESFKGMTRDEFGEALDKVNARLEEFRSATHDAGDAFINTDAATHDEKVAAARATIAEPDPIIVDIVDTETGEIYAGATTDAEAGIRRDQVETILSKSLAKGFSEQVVRDRIVKIYNKDLPDLTTAEADEVIARIDASMAATR